MTKPLSTGLLRWLPFRSAVCPRWLRGPPAAAIRAFTSSPSFNGGSRAPLPPRTPIPASDLTIAYLKGSGPGGQKINKTNSAVQIKHLPSGIVIKCQETRSRDQNEKLAIRKLQDRLEQMEMGEESRIGRRQELLRRRKKNAAKRARKKYGGETHREQCTAEEAEVHAAEAEQMEDRIEESDAIASAAATRDGVEDGGSKPDPFEAGGRRAGP